MVVIQAQDDQSVPSSSNSSNHSTLAVARQGSALVAPTRLSTGDIGTALSSLSSPEGTASLLPCRPGVSPIHGSNCGVRTVALILATMMGSGVLVLPSTFADLGVPDGLACLVSTASVSYFVSYLLHKFHLQYRYPMAVTLGDVFAYQFGLTGGWAGWGLLYISCLQWLGNYALEVVRVVHNLLGFFRSKCNPPWEDGVSTTTTTTLDLTDAAAADTLAVLLASVALLPFSQFRTLHALTPLCVVSVLSVITVISVDLVDMMNGDGSDRCPVVTSGTRGVVFAVSQMAFAFNGQAIFLEIQAEMSDPTKFLNSLWRAYPVLLVVYTGTAFVGWARCGDGSPHRILDGHMGLALAHSPPLFLCINVLLLSHFVTSYTIIQQVFGRELAIWLLPAALRSGTKARIRWFSLSVGQLVISLSAVHFVHDVCDVLGCLGLLVSTQTFMFPCVLFLATRRDVQLLPWPSLDKPAVVMSSFVIIGAVCLSVLSLIVQVRAR